MKTIFLLLFSLVFTQTAEVNDVQPYPDNSLYPEQYQEYGMPKPEELWNGSEYKRAIKVIKGFYNVDKWSLPRKESEYSEKLFERMINMENLKIIADKSEPLQERLRERDEILNSINQFLNLYYEPNEKEQRFGAEILSLLVVSSKSTDYSINIIMELQTMMSGRNMRNSDLDLMHDKLIAGVATTMEQHYDLINNNYKQYAKKDIEQFSHDITKWMLDVIHYLNETQLTHIIQQTQNIAENHINNSIQKDFKNLLKALKKLENQK